MAPVDMGPTPLSVNMPADFSQAFASIWLQGVNCVPGYPAASCDKAILSTSVSRGGEARAQFATCQPLRTTGDAARYAEREADKQPYRPGETLQRLAALQPSRSQEAAAPAGAVSPEGSARPESEGAGSSGGSDSEGAAADLCHPLRLGDASRELEGALTLGMPGVPTVGSVGHWLGTCKPCAFAFKGCQNGAQCPFCHLCLPGEKQRRRKLSKLAHREMRLHVQR